MNEVTEKIIGAAMKVHTRLGPGLLESAYEACLSYELAKSGIAFEQHKPQRVVNNLEETPRSQRPLR